MGPLTLPPPQAYMLVMSIETESEFIAEDHLPPVGHLPACAREGGKWRRIDSSDVVGEDVFALVVAQSSRAFVFLDALTLRECGLSLP
ncbi:hypothetical protein TNCV_744611 [Trichonephila clavipes]|nr:hypothetical protein TNCV_744611 [Trichonephila clavipes]